MPSATASGADKGAGDARSREHNQGNQGRTYTVEQKAAVLRIRKCSSTAFYDVLGLESVRSTCSDSDIKKAYRKQSLLTHPDKNGHEHADEAFKMVSHAFGVLGDKEKREKYDKYGTDPDSRFAQAQAQNPFSGFATRQASGGGGMGGRAGGRWEEELTPEEMFARFFGGGGGGGFGGPEFVFNFGGGPGIRVHQFGGARPRGRPREGQQQGQEQQQPGLSNLIGLLPILFFFILPLLSSLFSGSPSTPMPHTEFESPRDRYTEPRVSRSFKINYFVDPEEVAQLGNSKLNYLDRLADERYLRDLENRCEHEKVSKQRLREDAMGWFFQDPEKMAAANAFAMPACERVWELRR